MKKILIALIALLIAPSMIYATTDDDVTKRRPEKAAIQEIREERKEEKAELKEEFKEKIQEFRSRVAENHANRLENRFNFYYKRLSNILTRFNKRLEILKSSGKDVASLQTKLDTASAKLESARLKGAEAVAAFRAIDPAKFSEQKAEARSARDLAMNARTLFKETHTLLKEALRSLKLISKPALPAASPAVQNNQ